MKILYLVHQYFPQFQAGTEKFIINMASMAQQTGNIVKVITYDCDEGANFTSDVFEVYSKQFSYQGIPVLAFQYKNKPPGLHYTMDETLGVQFAKYILEREAPDLIHVGHLMRVYPIVFAAIELGIPYVLTLTDFHLLCPKILMPTSDTLCAGPAGGEACARFCSELPSSFLKQRLALSTKILKNAKELIAPSKFVADVFQREIPGIKVIVNNHGVRQSDLRPNDKIYSNGDDITFAFIGNLAVHKGPHHLIKAFSEMNHPRARLLIYGTGRQDFVTKLHQLAGDNKIEFRGSFKADTLPDVLSEIDVFVNPAIWYETYSFVNHEALSSEIPVICSKLGGMYEKIVDGKNGFTFPAGDSEALKDILLSFVESPTQLNAMKRYIRFETLIPTVEQEAYRYDQIYKGIFR
jgi:glycosyltransferase involved in cell wall biosynthesis